MFVSERRRRNTVDNLLKISPIRWHGLSNLKNYTPWYQVTSLKYEGDPLLVQFHYWFPPRLNTFDHKYALIITVTLNLSSFKFSPNISLLSSIFFYTLIKNWRQWVRWTKEPSYNLKYEVYLKSFFSCIWMRQTETIPTSISECVCLGFL